MSSRLLRYGLVGAILATGLCDLAPSGRSAKAAPKAPASEGRHWSFQPLRRPKVATVRDLAWVHTPIDAFVLARLERQGLTPAPAADRRTLLRRLYLDVLGLPPTPEEQQTFLHDTSPDAYERLVDRLLARPEYGERWARHWLDVARYAESNGYERDGTKPNAWRYRDYVIDSLNKDKPYDRFLTEQLAGDEMDGSNAATQIATSFLRLGTWDDEPADPLVDRYDQLDDVLGTTATAFLGLTLRCARCHDHKFEPFAQTDYYSMLAVFEPLKRPQKGQEELDRLAGTEAELTAYREALAKPAARIKDLQKQIIQWRRKIRARLAREENKAAKPGPLSSVPPEVVAAIDTDPDKRTTAQDALVKKHGDKLEKEIRQAATPDEKAERANLDHEIAAVNTTKPREPPHAYVWYEESAKPPHTHLFRRGNPAKPADEVGPALPAVLVSKQPQPAKPTARSTGRRLWLARWMTSPENPLVARVMVNRIWEHHFGQGLVATENDFGVMGQAPSHPELLDWLASELITQGWRLKPLHRMILLSSAYQMSCAPNPAAAKVDPDNTLLWRQRQRRLEAEVVRDAVLAVSGQLNPQMAGPSIYPALPQAVLDGQSRPGDGWGKSDEQQAARRSIYIFVKRSLAVPELDLLDMPDTTSSCDRRAVSTTGPQALTFMNGEFMQQQGRYLAERLQREAGADSQAQIQRAFTLTLCRQPCAPELQAAVQFLERQKKQIQEDRKRLKGNHGDAALQALEAFCLVLLNTNEFVYAN